MVINIPTIKIKNTELISKNEINIMPRNITVITGPNGSGKSLLLKYIFNFMIDNSVDACFVEQSNELFITRSTVLNNITMTEDQNINNLAKKMLEKYGLSHLLTHKISELSGGEKRIISVLRGVINNAAFLLIDEPTNDLDINCVETISSIIKDYSKSHTVIVVTHDDRIKKISDVLYCIENSRIITVKNNETISCQENESDRKNNNHYLKLFKKMYFGKWSYIIVIALFSLFYFDFYLSNFIESDSAVYEVMPDNVICIFSELTLDADEQLTGSIPTGVLTAVFDEDMSFYEKVKRFNRELEDVDKKSLYCDMEFDFSSESYTVYPINYFDFSTRQQMNVLYDGSVLSDYFESMSSYSIMEIIKTNKKDYVNNQLTDYYNDIVNKNIKCVGVVVELNEIGLTEFLKMPEIKKIMKGNFRIRSSETERFVNKLNEYNTIRSTMGTTIIIAGIHAIVQSLMCILMLYINADIILMYRDAGIEKEKLADILKGQYKSNRIIYVIDLFVLLSSLLALFVERQVYVLGVAPIIFVLMDMINRKICVKIIKNRISYICDWRYRG